MLVTVNVSVRSQGASYTGDVKVSDKALDAVLFDFNPSGSEDVTRIKLLHAALISMMQEVQAGGDSAKARAAAIAITELEGTQMRAVKALFAK